MTNPVGKTEIVSLYRYDTYEPMIFNSFVFTDTEKQAKIFVCGIKLVKLWPSLENAKSVTFGISDNTDDSDIVLELSSSPAIIESIKVNEDPSKSVGLTPVDREMIRWLRRKFPDRKFIGVSLLTKG